MVEKRHARSLIRLCALQAKLVEKRKARSMQCWAKGTRLVLTRRPSGNNSWMLKKRCQSHYTVLIKEHWATSFLSSCLVSCSRQAIQTQQAIQTHQIMHGVMIDRAVLWRQRLLVAGIRRLDTGFWPVLRPQVWLEAAAGQCEPASAAWH